MDFHTNSVHFPYDKKLLEMKKKSIYCKVHFISHVKYN